jgi:hypothetical protein
MPSRENPAIGFWNIHSLEEEVFVPSNLGVHEEFFPVLYVTHSPVLPCHAPFYQISNARAPIPLGTLDDELVGLLARETAMKGKDYVKHFVKRYIKTIHPFDATFTREADTRLKNNIVKLLIEAGREPYDEIEAHAVDKWYERIRPPIEEEEEEEEEEERHSRYNMLALDIDMLENDIAHEIFFNSKGRIAVPGNKMAALDFKEYYTKERNYEHARNTYFPHLKPKPVEPGRKKHSQRRREKKIMEKKLEEMRQQGEDPWQADLEWLRNISRPRPSNGGSKRRRRRRSKSTKKQSKKRVNKSRKKQNKYARVK